MKKLLLSCKYRKCRRRKEIMRKVQRVLTEAEQYEKHQKKLSEIDTQVLLVEPILCLAGYDIYNPCIIKRTSRGARSQEFDIEVYKNGKLFLAIEVKSLSSKEFNIRNINNGIGALSKSNQINGQWTNNLQDGVGQLRAYCVNWQNKINNTTIPILTNGKEWVLFNLIKFTDAKNIEQNINKIKECSMLLGRAKVRDKCFYNSIIEKIRNT